MLKARVGEPELDSAGLAERLSARLGKAVALGWVRVTLHRARDQFIDLLVQEVAATLQDPSPAALIQELIELGLYERCRSTMKAPGPRVVVDCSSARSHGLQNHASDGNRS